MTTLDPSHNIFREPKGRHAQAVHRADDIPLSQAHPGDSEDDLSIDDGLPDRVNATRKAKREARRKVRGAMPPMPDLRFEQSYLLSIRPFLTPQSTSTSAPATSSSSAAAEASRPSTALIKSADEDRVFGWDKKLDVNWSMVIYVTLRDQLFSPLIQGALWGWGTFLLASTATALRSSLYPTSALPRDRVTLDSDPSKSGLMGDISDRGSEGESGWWRRFVKSWTGGVEAATVT